MHYLFNEEYNSKNTACRLQLPVKYYLVIFIRNWNLLLFEPISSVDSRCNFWFYIRMFYAVLFLSGLSLMTNPRKVGTLTYSSYYFACLFASSFVFR